MADNPGMSPANVATSSGKSNGRVIRIVNNTDHTIQVKILLDLTNFR